MPVSSAKKHRRATSLLAAAPVDGCMRLLCGPGDRTIPHAEPPNGVMRATLAERGTMGVCYALPGGQSGRRSADRKRRTAMVAQLKATISEEEYLAQERAGEIRHEYHRGKVIAIVGASREHNLIVTSTVVSLGVQLRKRPCELYSNDMRLKIAVQGKYMYPDIAIVCGGPRFADDYVDNLLNPTVVIEVLSPSTEAYDRGEKFESYRTIESLREYLLIAQDRYHADHFVRQDDGSWLLTDADGLEAVIALQSIGCQLPLAEVYEKLASRAD
jgi:Uma2 family endonuclease